MTQQRPEGLAALMRAAAASPLELPVDGVSMGTTIVAGSTVTVRALSRTPRRLEVWAFVNDAGTIVVHRFRRRTADGLLHFRGDGLWYYDNPVPASHLIGRVHSSTDGTHRRMFNTRERAGWILFRIARRLHLVGR